MKISNHKNKTEISARFRPILDFALRGKRSRAEPSWKSLSSSYGSSQLGSDSSLAYTVHQCTIPKHKNQFSSAAAKSKKLFTSTRSRLASVAWWINDLNLSCALSDKKNKTEKSLHLNSCAMKWQYNLWWFCEFLLGAQPKYHRST